LQEMRLLPRDLPAEIGAKVTGGFWGAITGGLEANFMTGKLTGGLCNPTLNPPITKKSKRSVLFTVSAISVAHCSRKPSSSPHCSLKLSSTLTRSWEGEGATSDSGASHQARRRAVAVLRR
ncbi:hypothetical protein PIB30_111810, partial [Stylosanthes scabra]|nr:hypothetical protein [Stylosanthes scabra]